METNAVIPVLSIQNVGKAYGENWVLSDVSIDIMPGEIHAICGENGAGKSTLMNILFGMSVISDTGGYAGKIFINGEECRIASPDQAIAKGIGMVHQEFMLIPGFSASENIKLNREPLNANIVSRFLGRKLKTVDFAKINSNSKESLDKLGICMDETQMVDTLPVGYMQFVEIAREIDKENMKVLILDEPTAVLTESEAEIVLKVVKRLSSIGISVLLITHRINDIMEIADKVTILRDGRNVKTMPVSETSPGEIAQLMVGRELDLNTIQKRIVPIGEEVAMSLRNFIVHMPGEMVRGIDLDVRRGEILGIGGLAGQGKVGIANGIMGIFPTEGEAIVFGKPLKLNSSKASMNAKLAFVSEDRRRMGFAPDLSIALNIAAPAMFNYNQFFRRILFFEQIDEKGIDAVARQYIEEFQIKCTGPQQPVGTLSGGNQQKVCIASVLMLRPDILLVSEPTRGIDVGAKNMVLNTITKINRELGVTVIFTSSELAELRQVCDRIAIIADGQISDILPADADSEVIGVAMSGKRR
ncbi:ATP-binding cassette domain-containing protein [Oscillibacter sp.]|uniref:sugar ABC transporter ATP-binding protein n=1 Tax=Oscillibacter sp. TaxID=1945593 RepID=UPI003392DDD6